jgi:hypothetical protein
MTFVTNADDDESQGEGESEESISNALVLLGRQFNKVLKRVDRRGKQNA